MLAFIDEKGILCNPLEAGEEALVCWYDDEMPTSRWFRGDEVLYELNKTNEQLRNRVENSLFISAYSRL